MPGRDNRIAVVVGTVTDDVRIQDIPKLKVTPYSWSSWTCLLMWDCGLSIKERVINTKWQLAKPPHVLFVVYRSVLWGLLMVPASESWRQVVRWWLLTSWLWLLPKDRAQCCCQVNVEIFVLASTQNTEGWCASLNKQAKRAVKTPFSFIHVSHSL